MGIKSEKKSNESKNHSNMHYEVDGIIFALKFLYKTIKSIDKNLVFFIRVVNVNVIIFMIGVLFAIAIVNVVVLTVILIAFVNRF